MKTERLYAITVYLLNHGRTSAKELAQHFEVSAMEDPGAKHTLEKISHLSRQNNSSIILDFSVLREGEQETLQRLQTAIAGKRAVEFLYTNDNNETRVHCVEPVTVIYRWYAWYLLAYSEVKDDYRNYKLVRMQNLRITEKSFVKKHESADVILRKTEQTDSRKYMDIFVKCKETARQ